MTKIDKEYLKAIGKEFFNLSQEKSKLIWKWYLSLNKNKKIGVGVGTFIFLWVILGSCVGNISSYNANRQLAKANRDAERKALEIEKQFESESDSRIPKAPCEDTACCQKTYKSIYGYGEENRTYEKGAGLGSQNGFINCRDLTSEERMVAFEAKQAREEKALKERIRANNYGCVIGCLKPNDKKVYVNPYLKWTGKKSCPDDKKLLDGKTCNDGPNAIKRIPTWGDVKRAQKLGLARNQLQNSIEIRMNCKNKDTDYLLSSFADPNSKRCKWLLSDLADKFATELMNYHVVDDGTTRCETADGKCAMTMNREVALMFPCEDIGALPPETQLDIYFNPGKYLKGDCANGACFGPVTYRSYGENAVPHPDDKNPKLNLDNKKNITSNDEENLLKDF